MTHRRLGVHAGLWGFDWSDSFAEHAIAEAANIGYDYIEIPASAEALATSGHTRHLLQKHGIDATVSLALDDATDITSTDPTTSALGESALMDAIAFAKNIGADFVGGVTYSAMARYQHLPTDIARATSLDILRRVAAAAHTSGITLGVEFVNRYESNLLNTVDQTLAYLVDLGADNAVLHLDTFHAHIEEPSVVEAITKAGSTLGYIHASESHRGLIGTGAIDWDGFIHRLEAGGNPAPITVETFSSAVVSDSDAINIGLWAPSWSDPDEAAAHSFDFLTTLIEQARTNASVDSDAHHTHPAS